MPNVVLSMLFQSLYKAILMEEIHKFLELLEMFRINEFSKH